MDDAERQLEEAALAFARGNRRAIASRCTDLERYPPEADPVSVFMAGSPGAGKTEASIELIGSFGAPVIRIDADELRTEFPGYSGGNANVFQGSVSLLVERIHDRALKQSQSFVLDGTLASFRVARDNITRSLKRGRTVQILYVYQEPVLAWEFVQAREAAEGRRIRPVDFIEQYFGARATVNSLKIEFGKSVRVDLLMKNIDNTHRFYRAGVDQIDSHIAERVDRPTLERLLGVG